MKGNPPAETRPGYMNVVHGIAVDPVGRRVYVCDRGNRRMQVFDEERHVSGAVAFRHPVIGELPVYLRRPLSVGV